MNIKSAIVYPTALLTALLAVLISATDVSAIYAQNNGFQIGQVQPQNPQNSPPIPSVIAPITSPIQPTGNPILPLGGGIPRSNNIVVPDAKVDLGNNNFVTVLPAGGTVFVPAGTLVIESGPGMQSGAFLSAPLTPSSPSVPLVPKSPSVPGTPNGTRGGNTSLQRSNRPANGNETNNSPTDTSKQDVTRLALGTPREKVIEKYGNPVAFIMNMNGETLYFKDGVVVFVKDGVVATPVNPDGAIHP